MLLHKMQSQLFTSSKLLSTHFTLFQDYTNTYSSFIVYIIVQQLLISTGGPLLDLLHLSPQAETLQNDGQVQILK